jgi:hypothetical protein
MYAKTVQVWNVVTSCVGTGTSVVAAGANHGCKRMQSLASLGWEFLIFLWALACRFRTPLLIASGVGLLVGAVCYHSGPVVASTVSGFAGFCASLIASLVRKGWREVEKLNSLLT